MTSLIDRKQMGGGSLFNRMFSNTPKIKNIFFALLSVGVILIPISSQGLWIDEGVTAWFSSQSSLVTLLREVYNAEGSEAQLPGYLSFMWIWVRLFGHSEIALRLSNLPFILLFFMSATLLPAHIRFKKVLIGLMLLSPILWVYLNEARYYVAVFSLSGIGICGLAYYYDGKNKLRKIGPYVVAVSILLACAFSMLSFFIIPVIIAIAIAHSRNKLSVLVRDWRKPVLLTIPFYLLMAIYYAVTISKGSGGQRERPGIANLAFVLYEFFGFQGLGPPRNELRTNNSFGTFEPYFLVFVLAVTLVVVALLLLVASWRDKPMLGMYGFPCIAGFVIGLGFFFAASYVADFRFWGRHIISLLPSGIFFFAQLIIKILDNKTSPHLMYALFVLAMLWLISDYNIRFDQKYQKDDYKSAVEKAIDFAGNNKTILWNGNAITASYYGLRFRTVYMPPCWNNIKDAVLVNNVKNADSIRTMLVSHGNSVLVLSKKKDIFDVARVWEAHLNDFAHKLLLETKDFTFYDIQWASQPTQTGNKVFLPARYLDR